MKIGRSEFVSIIQRTVGGDIDVDDIKPRDRLADIGVDSLSFALLLSAIEDKLDVHVDDKYLESLNGLSTLSDVVAVFAALGHEIEIEDDVQ